MFSIIRTLGHKFKLIILILVLLIVMVTALVIYREISKVVVLPLVEDEFMVDINKQDRSGILLIGADEKDNGLVFIDSLIIMELDKHAGLIKIFTFPTDIVFISNNKSGDRTFRNTLALDISATGKPNVTQLMNEIELVFGINLDGYIYMPKRTFINLLNNFKTFNIKSIKEIVDPDLSMNKVIRGESRLNPEDFFVYLASEANGYDNQSERKVEGMLIILGKINLPNILIHPGTYLHNIGSIRSNIPQADLYGLFFDSQTWWRRAKIISGYLKYNSAFINQKNLQGGLMPVFEPIDNSIQKVFVDQSVKIEQATLDVLNASELVGKASHVSRVLKNRGIRITLVGNSEETREESVLYVSEPELYPRTIGEIEMSLGGELKTIQEVYPDRSVGDLVLIIGKDAGR